MLAANGYIFKDNAGISFSHRLASVCIHLLLRQNMKKINKLDNLSLRTAGNDAKNGQVRKYD